jgi:hypothetical protein
VDDPTSSSGTTLATQGENTCNAGKRERVHVNLGLFMRRLFVRLTILAADISYSQPLTISYQNVNS